MYYIYTHFYNPMRYSNRWHMQLIAKFIARKVQKKLCDITSQSQIENKWEFKFMYVLLINTIYHVLLRNLRGGVPSLLAFETHRGMQRELEVVDTRSKCVQLNYSRLIIVSTSGEEICQRSGSVSPLPLDFRGLSGRNSGILQAIWQSGRSSIKSITSIFLAK